MKERDENLTRGDAEFAARLQKEYEKERLNLIDQRDEKLAQQIYEQELQEVEEQQRILKSDADLAARIQKESRMDHFTVLGKIIRANWHTRPRPE